MTLMEAVTIKWDKHSPTNLQSNRYEVRHTLLYYTIKKSEYEVR